MNQETFLQIVAHYLAKYELPLDDNTQTHALRWASGRGGRSGRIAYQFSRQWAGQQLLK